VLRDLSPLELWGPEGVTVLTRIARQGSEATMACHVLNRSRAAAGEPPVPMRYLSIGLKHDALPGRAVSARWHAPGQEPVALELETLPGLVRLVIPRVDEWGVVEVRCSE